MPSGSTGQSGPSTPRKTVFWTPGKAAAAVSAKENALSLPSPPGKTFSKASGPSRPPYNTLRAFILLIISAKEKRRKKRETSEEKIYFLVFYVRFN
jgi:hypothetical protein